MLAAIHFVLVAIPALFIAGIPVAILICRDRPRGVARRVSAIHGVKP